MAKCSCESCVLGNSDDSDMSSSHWGTEPDLALKDPGVNYVIFKVLIDKLIGYSLKHSIEESKLKGTVPNSSSGCQISRLVFVTETGHKSRSMQACTLSPLDCNTLLYEL